MARNSLLAEMLQRDVRRRVKELMDAGILRSAVVFQVVAAQFYLTDGTVCNYCQRADNSSLDLEIAEYKERHSALVRTCKEAATSMDSAKGQRTGKPTTQTKLF